MGAMCRTFGWDYLTFLSLPVRLASNQWISNYSFKSIRQNQSSVKLNDICGRLEVPNISNLLPFRLD